MPEQPIIAIFAQSPAKASYLEDLVRAAGYQPRLSAKAVPEAALLIVADQGKDPYPKNEGQPVLRLGMENELKAGEGVRIIKTPVRASDLIYLLIREVGGKEAALPKLAIGGYTLDMRENLWLAAGESPLRLTEKEVAILRILKESAGRTVSRQQLLEKVWSYAQGVETHTLETHIYRLRQKIELDPSSPKILLTAEEGYRLGV